jgi:hypothetical protein
MDWNLVLNTLSELAYLLIVFGIMWFIAVFRGRQAIINLIFGLYLALLISIQFPYYDALLEGATESTSAIIKLGLFVLFAVFATWLFARVMPDEFQEGKMETMGKKILLASVATILVMIFSFNVLPVTEFLTPGTPIQSIFAPQEYFFSWLVLPLLVLFFI